jgi:predicted transcriptional regulator
MPGKDRDDESGEYTTTYPDSKFVESISTANGMATTREVAESVGCSHQTAYDRLNELDAAGEVKSRKMGNSLVWMLAE